MEPPPLAAAPPPPKRWPVGLLVGFLNALIGAIVIAPVSDWVMKAHHVSSFEGGRGYAVVCIWIPVGFLAGFAAGLVVSLMLSGKGFAGFLKRQALAAAALLLAIGTVAGLSYATAERLPLLNGQPLALDVEVRVPAKGRTVNDLQAEDFAVALVVSSSDRNYSDIRWSEARTEGNFIVIPAWARLNSRNASRQVTAGGRDENRQVFDVLLPPSPKKIDDAWSDWRPPRQLFDGSKPALADEYAVRYRVRFADEYSPSPTPAEPETSPVPTEEVEDVQ